MDLKSLIKTKPIIFETDLLSRVRTLMFQSKVWELPVVSEKELLGIITVHTLVKVLDKFELGSVIAKDFITKDFITVNVKSRIAKFAKRFIQTKHSIACVKEKGIFRGYIRRLDLLAFLFNSKRKVKHVVRKRTLNVSFDESLKNFLPLMFQEKPILVLKKGRPWSAFLPEELQFLTFVSDYITRKVQRDFETLRGERRELLRMRIHQQLLRSMKEEALPYLPPLRVAHISPEKFVINEKSEVGEAAKLMVKRQRQAIAVQEGGVVTDLSLLRCLA